MSGWPPPDAELRKLVLSGVTAAEIARTYGATIAAVKSRVRAHLNLFRRSLEAKDRAAARAAQGEWRFRRCPYCRDVFLGREDTCWVCRAVLGRGRLEFVSAGDDDDEALTVKRVITREELEAMRGQATAEAAAATEAPQTVQTPRRALAVVPPKEEGKEAMESEGSKPAWPAPAEELEPLVKQGLSNKQIAERYGVTEGAVGVRLSKFGIKRATQAKAQGEPTEPLAVEAPPAAQEAEESVPAETPSSSEEATAAAGPAAAIEEKAPPRSRGVEITGVIGRFMGDPILLTDDGAAAFIDEIITRLAAEAASRYPGQRITIRIGPAA